MTTEHPVPDETIRPARRANKVVGGIAAVGTVFVTVGLLTGTDAMTVAGFILLFIAASWFGLTF